MDGDCSSNWKKKKKNNAYPGVIRLGTFGDYDYSFPLMANITEDFLFP